MTVLEKISEVEQSLKYHRDVVAKLPESPQLITSQGNGLHLDGAYGRPLGEDPSGARASETGTLGSGDPPLDLTGTSYPNSDQPTQSITRSLDGKSLLGGNTTRNEMQRESLPQPVATASEGSGLHASDFIQKLSE